MRQGRAGTSGDGARAIHAGGPRIDPPICADVYWVQVMATAIPIWMICAC